MEEETVKEDLFSPVDSDFLNRIYRENRAKALRSIAGFDDPLQQRDMIRDSNWGGIELLPPPPPGMC